MNSKAILPALILAASAAACASALPPPRADQWVGYGGSWHARRIAPENGRTSHDADYGGVPEFRIRLRGPGPSSRPVGRAPAERSWSFVDVEPDALASPAAAAGAAMLRGIVSLDLPESNRADAFDLHRQALAALGPSGAARVRRARTVGLAEDLTGESASAVAHLCRRVEIETAAALTVDICTIEAVVDRADGWPLVTRITRMAEDAGGAHLLRSFTFIRTDSAQPAVAPRR